MAKTRDVSHSELDAARQCLLKHELGYKELWQPKQTAPALSRGSLFHRVLECYYREKAGIPWPDEPLKEGDLPRTIEECLYSWGGVQTEEQELVEWIYNGYLECYGDDLDWEILDVEFKIRGWLTTPRGTRSSFRLNGTADLLVRDHSAGGGLWIVDHKTISKRDLSKSLEKDLDFDDQSAIYTRLMRDRGMDIRGVIFNHCRSDRLQREMTMKERFRRTITVRTQTELDIMVGEVYDTFKRAYQRPLGISGQAPRSPNPDTCKWRCPFTEPCLASRKGVPIETLMEELEYRKGDPRY